MKTVVTGAGVISTAGYNLSDFWNCLNSGTITYSRNAAFADDENYRIKICAMINDEKWSEPECCFEEYGRAANYSIAAAVKAARSSGLDKSGFPAMRTAVVIGTTMGEIQQEEKISEMEASGRLSDIPDIEFSKYNTGKIGLAVSRALQISGPLYMVPAACAAGNYSVYLGKKLIDRGLADVAVVGGVDVLSRVAFTGFQRLISLTPDFCRPFDKNRKGIVIGEGCGMLILESEQSAKNRGAKPLAEIAGVGLASDCYHMTSPHPEGAGDIRAMEMALSDAGIKRSDIDYISAHATGTPANDRIESKAMLKVFGEGKVPPASSIKSMIGHAMGAASSIELISCLLMMEKGIILPTVNHETNDEECPIDCVPNVSRKAKLSCVMSNSFAFGGQTSSVILKECVDYD
jgi:3-oxoacyl-[acyl-carrier-protein] synthase II